MDRWSGKRAIEGRADSKKGVLRDRFNSNSPICSDEKKSIKFGSKEKSVLSSKIYGSSSSSSKQPLDSCRGSEEEAETQVSLGRDKTRVNHKLNYGTPEAESSSSRIKRGFRQRFGLSKQEFHPGPSGQSTSANRGCSPLLSGGFGLEKRLSRKVDTMNKRKVYGESSCSSSARGKNITAEERGHPRHCMLNDDNDVASVGSQRSVIRFSNRGTGLSSITTTETETSNPLNSPVSLELFSGFPEFSQDSFRNYNLDGISEILPQLDRIEQDIELNYEELLIMETGLLLGGLSFYDQHRDMRLDIDNMSYEELLALEERIGTVSTALTEEAISNCLKTSIYQISITKIPCDAKCSICQEEYNNGDEVGRLQCEHRYHVKCVQEWLRIKSWCPICRAVLL